MRKNYLIFVFVHFSDHAQMTLGFEKSPSNLSIRVTVTYNKLQDVKMHGCGASNTTNSLHLLLLLLNLLSFTATLLSQSHKDVKQKCSV